MAKFCENCGKALQEGEVCNCQQPAAPQPGINGQFNNNATGSVNTKPKKSKKKKIIIGAVVAIFVVILLIATSNDPVADDLEKFINEDIKTVENDAEELVDYLDELTYIDEYSDEEEIEEAISLVEDKISPKVEEVLKGLEDINPETDEVKELKGMFVDVITIYKEGMDQAVEGMNNLDLDKLENADKLINEEAEKKLDEYNSKLDELMKEHDLTWTSE